MRAKASRTFEMSGRVLIFSDANPDTDEGNTLSAQQLKEIREQMRQVAAAQRQGLLDKAAGWAEKAKLRREILDRPIAHLAEVGKRAGRRVTDLGLAFRYQPGTQTYVGFRTAARAMQATAQAKKEVLMKFGLSEAVLGQFGELLDQFDAAIEQTDRGRTAHKGATQQLDELAQELASVVRTMDARNRSRFRDNRGLLESWISASTILGVRRGEGEPAGPPAEGTQGGTPGAGGEVRPAA
jgi:hypothetical protein